MVKPVLLRSAAAFHTRNPWQAALAVLAVALGVSMVVAVDLTNESARKAFRISAEAVTGSATHHLTAAAGIPDDLYADLRITHGFRASAPVVLGGIRVRDERLQLLGIDPFAESRFRDWRQPGSTRSDFARLLNEPGAVLTGRVTADRLGLETDDRIEVLAGGRRLQGTVAGVVESANPQAMDGVLLADISTAQELLSRVGRVDRIDLILDRDEAARLRDLLPDGFFLDEAQAGTRNTLNMSRAFHTNLAAMGLLSVLVGAFLIYNMMTFTVLRRRPTLAIQRMLGVTKGEIFALVMVEMLVLGLAGSLAGLVLGWLLGQGLLGMVTRTINDLYFQVTVTSLNADPLLFLKGLLVGTGAALLAGLGPATEAARSSPLEVRRRSSLERLGHRRVFQVALAGIVLCLGGSSVLQLSEKGLGFGFVALFMVVLGFAMLVPVMVLGILRVVTPVAGAVFGVTGRFASRGVSAALSRTGVAIAALTVAAAATVGVGIMIESFRDSVSAWLQQMLQSDLYVSVDAPDAGTLLDPRVEALVRNTPGVAALSTGRTESIRTIAGEIDVLVLGPGEHSREGYRFLDADAESVWPLFEKGEIVLASEPLAWRLGIGAGDSIEMPGGNDSLPELVVGGVFRDYSSSQGILVVNRQMYERHRDDAGVATVGVRMVPGADPEALSAAIGAALSSIDQDIVVRRAGAIREASLEIFDRTFAVTAVLRWLTIGVALAGFLGALLALQIEQAREHALLRATGVTRAGLLGIVLSQTGIMGLMAGLLALPLGGVMSLLLIHVINRRSFGWSMETTIPPEVMAEAVVLSLGAALVAGVLPALRMSRIAPAAALREE